MDSLKVSRCRGAEPHTHQCGHSQRLANEWLLFALPDGLPWWSDLERITIQQANHCLRPPHFIWHISGSKVDSAARQQAANVGSSCRPSNLPSKFPLPFKNRKAVDYRKAVWALVGLFLHWSGYRRSSTHSHTSAWWDLRARLSQAGWADRLPQYKGSKLANKQTGRVLSPRWMTFLPDNRKFTLQRHHNSQHFAPLRVSHHFAQMFGDVLGIPISHAMAFWLCSCISLFSGLDTKNFKRNEATFPSPHGTKETFSPGLDLVESMESLGLSSTWLVFEKRGACFKLLIVVLDMMLLSQWRWSVRISERVGSLLMTTDLSWSLRALRPRQTHNHSSFATSRLELRRTKISI